jgi:endonuclease/exonuclease/phosphatase family metal-dependent hydrolase
MIHTRSLSSLFVLPLLTFTLAAGAADVTPRPAANGAAIGKAAAAATTQPATADSLCVMSINLEHHDKPEEMRAMAENLKSLPRMPDFILCQEVYFERRDKVHTEDNTAAVFADYLGYYCKGTKRTSDREGIAIISKYPFDHYDSINLKSQTLRVLLGFRRVSVMGEFTVPGLGKVRITDTHLTNWPWEGHVRNKQIAETMKWIEDREKAAPAALNFFGGDFNARSQWSEMDQVKNSTVHGGLVYHDYNGTDFTQGSHGNPSQRIDFIFVSAAGALDKAMQFTGEQLLWKAGLTRADGEHFYPSDHLGVIHTYTLPAVAQQTTPAAGAIRTANVND